VMLAFLQQSSMNIWTVVLQVRVPLERLALIV
jgi:hypothetical protein